MLLSSFNALPNFNLIFSSDFAPFSSDFAPSNHTLLLLSSSLQEMECIEAAALKNSLRKEMALKSSITPQVFLEDIWVVNNSQNGLPCDDFFVDDLFDFTNDEGFLEQQVQQLEHEVQEQQQQEASSHKKQKLSPRQVHDQDQHFPDGIIIFSDQELAVPADDVANLEWLSHFIEDSFSEHSAAAYPAGMLTEKPNLTESEKPVPATCYNKTPVPGKARSKRTRTGGRVWSHVGSPPVTESSSSSTSSSSSSHSGSGSSSAPWVLCSNSVSNLGSKFELNGTEWASVEKKKKHKMRPVATESTGENVNQPTRRCSHCGVTKTPQWRAGPMGAKTLCNACGVRFKSGRLLPEYRPASSPTFSTELHSNHHRKVIEMRCKKEGLNQVETGLVSNFG